MTYHPTGTTLISRRGYGGPTPTGLGGILDTIGSFVKDGVSAAVDVYKSGQQAAGGQAALQTALQQQAAAQARPAGMPTWVLPVALVGGAGVLALVLLKKKPRRNPSRGRRRHHARRRNAGDANRPGEFYPPSRVGRPSLVKVRKLPKWPKRRRR